MFQQRIVNDKYINFTETFQYQLLHLLDPNALSNIILWVHMGISVTDDDQTISFYQHL